MLWFYLVDGYCSFCAYEMNERFDRLVFAWKCQTFFLPDQHFRKPSEESHYFRPSLDHEKQSTIGNFCSESGRSLSESWLFPATEGEIDTHSP